jgi:hypothetical protein
MGSLGSTVVAADFNGNAARRLAFFSEKELEEGMVRMEAL